MPIKIRHYAAPITTNVHTLWEVVAIELSVGLIAGGMAFWARDIVIQLSIGCAIVATLCFLLSLYNIIVIIRVLRKNNTQAQLIDLPRQNKMAGVTELDILLNSMSPELQRQEFVFCTVTGDIGDYSSLNPIAIFVESEGLTLILEKSTAEKADLKFEGSFRQITLTVHSSLEAVGLTAAVSTKLASKGISANVIAAYYHDHIFVQSSKADAALSALLEFGA